MDEYKESKLCMNVLTFNGLEFVKNTGNFSLHLYGSSLSFCTRLTGSLVLTYMSGYFSGQVSSMSPKGNTPKQRIGLSFLVSKLRHK